MGVRRKGCSISTDYRPVSVLRQKEGLLCVGTGEIEEDRGL